MIVGGESGPGARPLKLEWVNSIYKECKRASVPFFFKQWGSAKFNADRNDPTTKKSHPQYAKGGCQLMGRVIREMPGVVG